MNMRMTIIISGVTDTALCESVGRIRRSPLFKEVNITEDLGETHRVEMSISGKDVENNLPTVFVTDHYIKIESAIDDFYIFIRRSEYYSISVL